MLDPNRKLYRWGPISACPLFLYYAIEPAFTPLKKLFGITYSESLIIFKQGKVEWFLDDKDLGVESKKFADAVIMHPDVGKKFNRAWDERTNKLVEQFSILDVTDFSTIPDNKLITLFQQFSKAYYNWFTVTISLELASSSIEPLMGGRLKTYFSKNREKQLQKAFSVLTAPLELTFYRREQRDILHILQLPKAKRVQALQLHQKKYYWILNSYAQGKPLLVSYFKKELKKLTNTNWQATVEEIKTYPSQIARDKQELLFAMNPSTIDARLIKTVEQLARLMDVRKEYNFRAEYYLEQFVQEISRRTQIPTDDLKYLSPEELAEVSGGTRYQSIIADRKQCFVFVCTASKIESFTGKNAQVIVDQFSHVNRINESVIHGRVASTGDVYYFRGTAKIIHTIKDIGQLRDGDILVTPMTSPDFVIGMKKAGAIITDVGGLLSHAAIVSRELHKPCIVGTEIATKVIHDGDVVELHCGKGTIRIIKYLK